MSKFMVKGGYSLFGEININGAKNAALPILCASILNKGTTTLNNIPKLSDTKTAVDILKALGCKITEFDKTLVIDSTSITSCKVPTELMSKMRCSIIFLGALTARLGEAEIAYPGGCCLGSRPIDLHLKALKKLGVEISEKNGIIKSKSVNPIGGKITLSFPSVGATQNSILAAVCANGLTNIKNAAKEPEVTDLCCFLNKMGADIDYSDKDEIKITGPCQFHDCEYSIISDRIEAGTYMCAVASTGGDVALNNINPNYIQSLSDILKQMGCDITALKNGIRIKSSKNLKAVSNIETGPYPLFPTDMQAQLMAVMASANGKSRIIEKIFESRNRHAYELNKMGANIEVTNGNEFNVAGVSKLFPADVSAYDLRGGAAMIVAALGCDGLSSISGAEHILRGYENIDKNINSLGGNMYYTQC